MSKQSQLSDQVSISQTFILHLLCVGHCIKERGESMNIVPALTTYILGCKQTINKLENSLR